jgi:hypothetical protein
MGTAPALRDTPAMRATPVLVLAFLGACGGAPTPAPTAAQPAAASSPASACLALADTPRVKKPGEPARIGVKHILVKYAGAKNAAPSITRTREEACLRALQARDALRTGAEVEAVVKEYSDEAGAESRGGSMGPVERKDLVPPFADAAFELSVGEFSDVVETDFGFHVISRYQ